MSDSRQILLDIEEEAIHVWREWPQFLALRRCQKQQVAAVRQQRGDPGQAPSGETEAQPAAPDDWVTTAEQEE